MENIFARMWENLIGRVGGPLTFRLILQPMVAASFAVRAGWRDAQQGRGLYGWEIIGNPVNRRELLREGWKSIAKVFVVAMIVDVIYQIRELGWLYPEEALIVAAKLALLPYLLLRGLTNRVLRRLLNAQRLR